MSSSSSSAAAAAVSGWNDATERLREDETSFGETPNSSSKPRNSQRDRVGWAGRGRRRLIGGVWWQLVGGWDGSAVAPSPRTRPPSSPEDRATDIDPSRQVHHQAHTHDGVPDSEMFVADRPRSPRRQRHCCRHHQSVLSRYSRHGAGWHGQYSRTVKGDRRCSRF